MKKAADSLPPTQSKEVLLLEHDYGKGFSKRKVDSNWDRYTELSDDENNLQLEAADFENILLAPRSIGEHFKFSSERNWEQAVDIEADAQINDLFNMNLTNMKNGVGQLPFYLRNDLPLEWFSNDEITDMNFSTNLNRNICAEKRMDRSAENVRVSAKILSTENFSPNNTKIGYRESINTSAQKVEKKSSSRKVVGAEQPNESKNIQDWLDDILNEP